MSIGGAERQAIEVNGRRYRWPTQPLVVVCVDGSEPDYAESDGGGYIERAVAAGEMPYMERMLAAGTSRVAESAMPSFTNPNNLSIVTGVSPAVHGICGNFFYDRESDAEVMMNDPKFLRDVYDRDPAVLKALNEPFKFVPPKDLPDAYRRAGAGGR